MSQTLRFASLLTTYAGTVAFVLTAGPARLYAETAPPPPACDAPEVVACADASPGSTCDREGTPGTCESRLCDDRDAGRITNALRCVVPAKPGPAPSASTPAPSASTPTPAPSASSPPKGGADAGADGGAEAAEDDSAGGCSTQGHTPIGPAATTFTLAALLGLAFARSRRLNGRS
ncbi:MAG: hypothetical protein IPK71_06670 [Myxococcales bacterium]|nr:hypothetical protein [Myxococcales bacterium]